MMNRKQFIGNNVFLLLGSQLKIQKSFLITESVFAEPPLKHSLPSGEISTDLSSEFTELIRWLRQAGWNDFLRRHSNLNLDVADIDLPSELGKTLEIRASVENGLSDFSGTRAIEPGNPAKSLLYHVLASPAVHLQKPEGKTVQPDSYATLEQLDLLENYIWGLGKINLEDVTNKKVVAVLAYEYRPAIETPHENHADFVFSRTGIGRVGNESMVWDRAMRGFTNKPLDPTKTKRIAVTPARYGVFLAEVVNKDGIYRSTSLTEDREFFFLKPIRKLFEGDPYLEGYELHYSEFHQIEKLKKVAQVSGVEVDASFDLTKPPFTRKSCTSTDPTFDGKVNGHDSTLVELVRTGSSVLVGSKPQELVRRAVQNDRRCRFGFPKFTKKGLGPFAVKNRRYTSLKLLDKGSENRDTWDIFVTEVFYPKSTIARFNAPRNAPLFVNIRYVDEEGHTPVHLGAETVNLEELIKKSYHASLFEDSICDGCVSAFVKKNGSSLSTNAKTKKVSDLIVRLPWLPAFSLTTAPDFFPLVKSDRIETVDHMFLAGGTSDLGGGRKRANPALQMPGISKRAAFPDDIVSSVDGERNLISYQKDDEIAEKQVRRTVAAVYSNLPGIVKLASTSDFVTTNFLPDSASKIFFPGWDATYSGKKSHIASKQSIFYATYGLGSPFVEDTKLCAAANGMWPVASPDSSRTFKGSLSAIQVNLERSITPPTSVPLMDEELGYYCLSPAVREYGRFETFGWDGEQGPYLERIDKDFAVNFTDIGRADYVENALNGKFDMSVLRELKSNEIIQRMKALKHCIRHIDHRNPDRTDLWLVGAEKVKDWTNGAEGYCISSNLFNANKSWATSSRLPKGGVGYLFLFAKTIGGYQIIGDSGKRASQLCLSVYLCQIIADHLAWCRFRTIHQKPSKSDWRLVSL